MPAPAAQDFAFGGTSQCLLEPVPFGAKVVDIRKHPGQQGFGRQCVYPCALKPKDIRWRETWVRIRSISARS
jgi:hypothetical protein